jgi:hypothetical protein
MKSDFKLVGFSRRKSMSCEPLNNENIFWPKIDMTQDRFNALFDWAKKDDGFWKLKWIAEIDHEGLYEDGTPINPVVKAIREIK